MATTPLNLNIDTTREESDSRSAIEVPIESTSPEMTSKGKASELALSQAPAAERSRVPPRSSTSQSIAQRNIDSTLFELDGADLELLEQRVEELERYLGIENMDIAYFNQHQGEDLNKKAQMLDKFMRDADDKFYCINELWAQFEKMDHFLKHERPFVESCMDLKQKTTFVCDWIDDL